MTLALSVVPRRVGLILICMALGLTLASVGAQYARYVLGYTRVLELVRLVDVNQEQSIPTWYAAVTLLLCAIILAVIVVASRQLRDGRTRSWAGLSLLALGCSVEEVAAVHEASIGPLRVVLGAGGLLYHTWVVPGAVLVLAISLTYARFIAGLDRVTRGWLVLAGFLYLTGALGVEMVGGAYAEQWGEETLVYAGLVAVEEFLEMAGVAVLVYALLSHLAVLVPEVWLRLGATGETGPPPDDGDPDIVRTLDVASHRSSV